MDLIQEDASISPLITPGPCWAIKPLITSARYIKQSGTLLISFKFQSKQNSFPHLHIFPLLPPDPEGQTRRGQAELAVADRGSWCCYVHVWAGLWWHRVAQSFCSLFSCFSVPMHTLSFAPYGAKHEGLILTSNTRAAFVSAALFCGNTQSVVTATSRESGAGDALFWHVPSSTGFPLGYQAALLDFSLPSVRIFGDFSGDIGSPWPIPCLQGQEDNCASGCSKCASHLPATEKDLWQGGFPSAPYKT